MQVELRGGPHDGLLIEGPVVTPYLVTQCGPLTEAVYRCTVCFCCAQKEARVDFQFIGYQPVTEVIDRAYRSVKI